MRIHVVVGILLSGIVAIIGSSASAAAVPVTFDFQGRVRLLLDDGGDAITLPSIQVGDAVSARLRYDTAMQNTGDPLVRAIYVGPGSISIRVNDLTFKYKGNLETTVSDNFNITEHFFDSVTSQGITTTPARWPSEFLPLDHAQLFLSWGQSSEIGHPLPSFITSVALPESANFFHIPGEGGIRVFPTADSNFIVSFVLGPTELAATPEPATLLLVGTTAAGLGLARWVKRRRAHRHEHEAPSVP